MIGPSPVIPRQELRDADGKPFAYFVPAAEMDRLLAEAADLRRQLAEALRQRAKYVAELTEVYKTFRPPPMTEAEMQEALANPRGIADVIRELEALR